MATLSEALAVALAHHQAGRFQAAEQIYRQVLGADPNQVDALHLWGVLAHQLGRHEVAVEHIGRAIELKPDEAAFHNNLASALKSLGRLDQSAASYRRAIELKPDFADAYGNLGNVLRDQGNFDEAHACYRRALELNPRYADAYTNRGLAFEEQGKFDEAVDSYRRALELTPRNAELYNNLANVLKEQGKLLEAVDAYRRALDLRPRYAKAHNNLGTALRLQGKLEEAAACYRRALEIQPEYAGAYNNLANTLKELGRREEASACYRRALELTPGDARTHSNMLMALHYQAGATPAELAEAHAEFDRLHAAPLRATWRPHENVRDPDRRLRVGFVSPDLGRHPVGYFLIRAFEGIDRTQVETICYSDRTGSDEITDRFRVAAGIWRDVISATDAQLAEQIRADRVDILFDLAGHTGKNRLLVFARKPAPVEITWIGYEGTTGLSAMDYLLADRHVAPDSAEPYFRERVLRMPESYLCYAPPRESPSPSPPPALSRGRPTFGSFNNLAKITTEVVDVWAQLLCRLPEARLVLKYRGLGDASVQQRYRGLFAARGVQPDRLIFLPATSYADYLATYGQIDIALDPFPFSGSATTCEALWMGVPVVTCPGQTFASRHSLCHLATIGLTETIAANLDDYVALAVRLAEDLPRLSALRAGLRERMATSPLCDGARFAGHWMRLLRDVWRHWCNSQEST